MKVLTLEEVRTLAKAAKGEIDKIYLHWTAGPYGIPFRDYHFNVDDDGTIYCMCEELTEKKAHTWHRNTGAIGISLCCCEGAQAYDGYNAELGEYPPTTKQIEALSHLVAVLCEELEIVIDKEHVMTHEEAATIDGYGPYSGDPETRWDLWYLPDYNDNLRKGGDIIRGKALWYLANA